ncbi:CLEC3A [Mytilus coruscus]|uniref:CLEC3A n=1 Tax=Mytilus coruscus TaxID=42192 RepID=A0A6J8E5B9_MYTCO|nr:CLEC3A [Mytilus coruscus]
MQVRNDAGTSLNKEIDAIELLLLNLDIKVKSVCVNIKSFFANCSDEIVVQLLGTIRKVFQDIIKDDVKTYLLKVFELTSVMNTACETLKKEYLGILRLPASFLQFLWSNRNSHVIADINFQLLNRHMQAELAGIVRQFETSEAYLEGLEKHLDDTNEPHIDTNMIKWFNIHEGTIFIGKVQKLIEDGMETENYSFFQAFHSNLTEPRTSDQQGFLSSELQQHSNIGSLDYWIGVTDIVLGNHWEYASDESTVTDLYWGPNEPNGQIVENCVVISASKFGKWHDIVCTTHRHFICEKENL